MGSFSSENRALYKQEVFHAELFGLRQRTLNVFSRELYWPRMCCIRNVQNVDNVQQRGLHTLCVWFCVRVEELLHFLYVKHHHIRLYNCSVKEPHGTISTRVKGTTTFTLYLRDSWWITAFPLCWTLVFLSSHTRLSRAALTVCVWPGAGSHRAPGNKQLLTRVVMYGQVVQELCVCVCVICPWVMFSCWFVGRKVKRSPEPWVEIDENIH